MANTLNQILRKDVEPSPGRHRHPGLHPRPPDRRQDRDVQNNASVAFVGYTPEYTASVMVFNP